MSYTPSPSPDQMSSSAPCERLAVGVGDAAAVEGRLAAGALGHVGAERQVGRALPVEGALHRGVRGLGELGGWRGFVRRQAALAGGGAQLVQDHDHHRRAQRVGQQDELLALVGAGLADGRQKFDALHPFAGLQVHLADEGMQVRDQRLHDLREARVARSLKAL
jgi:hypothetical protein